MPSFDITTVEEQALTAELARREQARRDEAIRKQRAHQAIWLKCVPALLTAPGLVVHVNHRCSDANRRYDDRCGRCKLLWFQEIDQWDDGWTLSLDLRPPSGARIHDDDA